MAAVTARSVTKKRDATHAINPEAMNGLRVAWQRYDRVSDDIGLLGDSQMEERIDAILNHSRMIAEKVIEDEDRFRQTRRDLGTRHASGIYVDPKVESGIQDQSASLLGVIGDMGVRAQAMLCEFNFK